jgi:hypothetical protein
MTFSPTPLVRADDSQGPWHISFGREPYIEHDGCMVDPALSAFATPGPGLGYTVTCHRDQALELPGRDLFKKAASTTA